MARFRHPKWIATFRPANHRSALRSGANSMRRSTMQTNPYQVPPTEQNRQRIAPSNLAAALGLLAAGLLITGIVVLYAKTDAEGDAQRKFDFAGDEIRLNITTRLRACAQVLSTHQLHGTVNFERGVGTTVEILFPIPDKKSDRL